ncbi:TfoX/Sxy family protein [Blastococcus sp. URHD0036]|uniref:TfoX/Sxy family protein n=1 Tax=Blastococcus sp. URHD0036 TaxID=1380356 RepID=UPI00054DE35A|nr:TfoX/Sxy family protein [Blastococcus sp. URHD0036]
MAVDGETLDRVRRVLAGRPDVEEKRMVGGRSFGVGGRLACGVSAGGLVVRVGRGGAAAALAEPHVSPLRMGGRTADGFVVVAPAGCADDAALLRWIDVGFAAAGRV